MAAKSIKTLNQNGNIYTVEIDITKARIIEIGKEMASSNSTYSIQYEIENVGNLTKEKRYLTVSEKGKSGVMVRYEIANVKKPLGEGG